MTTNEWRTDRPDVGRYINDIEGFDWRIRDDRTADAFHEKAQAEPDRYSWQYVDPSPEMVAAAELGAAYAGIVLFVRCVVPLGDDGGAAALRRRIWGIERLEAANTDPESAKANRAYIDRLREKLARIEGAT